jgi:5'(3')-deoxyribonucleotidase
MQNIHFPSVAKSIAITKKLVRALKYDLHIREYDGLVEVIGLIDDPTLSLESFAGRETLFPKRWVTLDVMSQKEVEAFNG